MYISLGERDRTTERKSERERARGQGGGREVKRERERERFTQYTKHKLHNLKHQFHPTRKRIDITRQVKML